VCREEGIKTLTCDYLVIEMGSINEPVVEDKKPARKPVCFGASG